MEKRIFNKTKLIAAVSLCAIALTFAINTMSRAEGETAPCNLTANIMNHHTYSQERDITCTSCTRQMPGQEHRDNAGHLIWTTYTINSDVATAKTQECDNTWSTGYCAERSWTGGLSDPNGSCVDMEEVFEDIIITTGGNTGTGS